MVRVVRTSINAKRKELVLFGFVELKEEDIK